MKPQHQKRRVECMRACVASILELPYDSVPLIDPDAENVETFLEKWRQFVRRHGYDLLWIGSEALVHQPKGYSIGVGANKDGEDHAVVCLDGKEVFDPYLGGAPIEALYTFGYFVALDPKAV